MKIVGFPVDISRSQDIRLQRGQRIRQALIQTTLDLIQAGDVEPGAGIIAAIAGVPGPVLFQHFPHLADLYEAAFELSVSRAFDPDRPVDRPVDRAVPLAKRTALLVSDRAQTFEQWLPVWHFAERVRGVAPAVSQGIAHLRRVLRERVAIWFAVELDALEPTAREPVLDSLDVAFGFERWMNMRDRLRLSPMNASRTWRFEAESIVRRHFTVSEHSGVAA
jgi:AcrR family transcriptional regulator